MLTHAGLSLFLLHMWTHSHSFKKCLSFQTFFFFWLATRRHLFPFQRLPLFQWRTDNDCGPTVFNTGTKYFCHLWQYKFDQDFMWTPNHTTSKLAWQFLCKSAFIKGLMPHIPECIVSTLVDLFCLLLMFMHKNVNSVALLGWFPRKMAFWF